MYYDQINGVVGFLPGGRGVCNTHTHTHLPGHTIQSDFLKGQNNILKEVNKNIANKPEIIDISNQYRTSGSHIY